MLPVCRVKRRGSGRSTAPEGGPRCPDFGEPRSDWHWFGGFPGVCSRPGSVTPLLHPGCSSDVLSLHPLNQSSSSKHLSSEKPSRTSLRGWGSEWVSGRLRREWEVVVLPRTAPDRGRRSHLESLVAPLVVVYHWGPTVPSTYPFTGPPRPVFFPGFVRPIPWVVLDLWSTRNRVPFKISSPSHISRSLFSLGSITQSSSPCPVRPRPVPVLLVVLSPVQYLPKCPVSSDIRVKNHENTLRSVRTYVTSVNVTKWRYVVRNTPRTEGVT